MCVFMSVCVCVDEHAYKALTFQNSGLLYIRAYKALHAYKALTFQNFCRLPGDLPWPGALGQLENRKRHGQGVCHRAFRREEGAGAGL